MKVVLIILGVLFLIVVAGVIGLCSFVQSIGSDIEPAADAVLKQMDKGEYRAVYDDATDAFRRQGSYEQFIVYGDARRNSLGAYRGITSRAGIHVATSAEEGQTGELKLVLEYENGSTNARIKFKKIDEVWKLLEFEVDIPEELRATADPEQLEGIARELIDMMAKQDLVALYDRFAPELKANWEASTFQKQMLDLTKALGPMSEATLESSEKDDKSLHQLKFRVAFENAAKGINLLFLDRNGTWAVVGFEVEKGRR